MASNFSFVAETSSDSQGNKAEQQLEPIHVEDIVKGSRIDRERVIITWKNIRVAEKERKNICGRVIGNENKILKGVSGFAKPGSLLAVIGSSGSGKTTLLNVLNGRNAKSLDVTGEIFANGVSMGPDISKISAYVQQDDLFMGELTVKEHLMFATKEYNNPLANFATCCHRRIGRERTLYLCPEKPDVVNARLRMEASLSSQDRVERVNDVMTQMRLVGCKNRRICTIGGDKVLSGGELKRLGVASELLAKPSILFLDEPTSGLDAFLAKVMVECLKQVSELGCTVICTIHQPSSEVFEIFDDLMILSMGRVVYHGEAAAAMQHYTENGSVCPPNYNPADFYINELSFLPGDEDKAREKINKLADSFEKSKRYKELVSLHSKSNEASNFAMAKMDNPTSTRSRYRVGFLQQLLPCIERSFRISFRNYQLRARLISNSLAGLIMGLVYLRAYNTPYQSEEVLDVNGLFFLIIMTATINGLITVVMSFPTQIDVAQREHRSALYSVLVFYLAKNIAELLSFILMPTLQCVLVYFMAGLYPGVREFFLFWMISVVVINTCVSLGYFISCISKSREMAVSLIAPFVLPTMILSDVMIRDQNVRIYLKWIKYISWFHYTNKLFMINQWSMVESIECIENQAGNMTSFVTSQNYTINCMFRNGHDVLEYQGIDQERFGEYFGCLMALLVGFRLLAFPFLLLKFRE